MKLYLTHQTDQRKQKPFEHPEDWIAIKWGEVSDYRDARHAVIEVEVGERGAVKGGRVLGALAQGTG